MKRIFLVCILMLGYGTSWAAPVVVVPGDAASYMYFPAAASAAPSASSLTVEPVGFIGMFPVLPLPDGWLACNGATISAADYPELVEYLAGVGAPAAVLPEMRGEHLRGLDSGRGLDVGRALLSVQGSQNLAHGHSISSVSSGGVHGHPVTLAAVPAHNHRLNGSQFLNGSIDSNHINQSGSSRVTFNSSTTATGNHSHAITVLAGGAHAHTISSNSVGGTEARPVNVSIIFAIKAN
jgi:microcystin-dependent protein